MTINERVQQIRAAGGYTLRQFADKIGISDSAVSQIEKGRTGISEQTIRSIVREFGVSEAWLRTGEEPMFGDRSREIEVAALTRRLMSDSPESFRRRLVETLLRFDPDGPEWTALEKIYRTLAADLVSPAPDDSPPDP